MNFNLFVPTWVLWALGLIAGLLLLGLAGLGVLFLIQVREFSRSMNRWFGW